jgi:hypothetical protein
MRERALRNLWLGLRPGSLRWRGISDWAERRKGLKTLPYETFARDC